MSAFKVKMNPRYWIRHPFRARKARRILQTLVDQSEGRIMEETKQRLLDHYLYGTPLVGRSEDADNPS